MKTSLLKYNLMLVALLACVQVFSQHKNTKHEAAKDTTHNKAPQTPVLSANGNCQGGTTLVKVEFPLSDSTAMPDYVLFYNIPVPQTYTDSATYNELILFKTLDYKELQANNFILATENAGAFCAKSMRQTSTGLVYSTYSNIVKTRQCSLVTFPDSFNKIPASAIAFKAGAGGCLVYMALHNMPVKAAIGRHAALKVYYVASF